MKKTILLLAFLTAGNLFAAGPKLPYTHQGFKTNDNVQIAVNFVSIDGIKESIKDMPPMTVSFDIDDTLIFSSQYFQYGFTYGPELGWGNNPKEVLNNQNFWDYVAEQADKHSIPKQSAIDIIKMHLERGDKIAFITGRTPHRNLENGTITETSLALQKSLKLPYAVPIWYTSETPLDGNKWDKTYYIKKVGSKIHYGDSDNDILAAREAGIRGIRVQRSYSSTNRQQLNGGYGEEVVINSAW
ncbi:acid phosphatase AphA [Streptobacillus canis]|uniref:acid phosphatase AphA n=1 Tax=Streptobacillus canis TaxID=2678686 RepID=UPI0012E1C844|nr:acid phosphatase AphA [Streptobacillus canis]